MARLANNRDTYLSREEIVREALTLFDATGDVSTRKLATALNVTPTAIYHHFADKRQLVLAVVDAIWAMAIEDLAEQVGDPTAFEGDPEEFFVRAALSVRRAFAPHPDAALYIGMSADPSPEIAFVFEVIASQFVKVGVPPEQVEQAFYTYTTFVLGSLLLVASRLSSDEYLQRKAKKKGEEAAAPAPENLDVEDEALFTAGVRTVLAGLPRVS